MFGEHFYHKQIRNTVIDFGTIFNNVNIKRTDSSEAYTNGLRVTFYHMRQKKSF